MRKMALFLANKDLRHLDRVFHSVSQGGTRLKAEDTTSQELPSKAITSARRSLLRIASSQKHRSTTNRMITGDSNLPRATKHTDTPTTNHLPHHVNVDVSATFHVDYSSPKTHPPRNN
ncbi:hypothetical protein KP509_02G074100 [Ceratopteris richardii]|nr:hypothetical protein KP509_02G074100 [Ceratopteris richardii]